MQGVPHASVRQSPDDQDEHVRWSLAAQIFASDERETIMGTKQGEEKRVQALEGVQCHVPKYQH